MSSKSLTILATKTPSHNLINPMQSSSAFSDLLGVLKGFEMVLDSALKHQTAHLNKNWHNSTCKILTKNITNTNINNLASPDKIVNDIQETVERSSMVYYGLKELYAQSCKFNKYEGASNNTHGSHSFVEPTYKSNAR